MIDSLDRMLAQVIHNGVDETLFIGFQAPDDDWRTKAIPGNANAVNIFLADIRENRRLRSNDRVRSNASGSISEAPSPRRIDCHYLITTWSPAAVTPQIDSTLDEHALLHAIATAFANADPLNAIDIFALSGLPVGFPSILLEYPLEVTLLPVEGFHKYAEFWGTMGRHHQPWKPAVYVVVTLPLVLASQPSGTMVTTASVDFLQSGISNGGETVSAIGGLISDSSSPPQPVPNAWVELLNTADRRLQLVNADTNGRFIFTGIAPASYRLRVTGPSSGPVTHDIDVPSSTGEYDFQI